MQPRPPARAAQRAEESGSSSCRFGRPQRILNPAGFRRVYEHGVRYPGPLFIAFCLARTGAEATWGARLGLTVPKAVGNAVVRNRIKRRLREVFRRHHAELGPEWDLVLNPRRAVAEAPFGDLERAFIRVIAKCKSHS